MEIRQVLDLYCGADGAAMGYYHAFGINTLIVGVDIKAQPHYPFSFVQTDALEYCAAHGSEFDFIHASPPCQAYTKAAKQWRLEGKEYPDMIAQTRALLKTTGRPYVIENVPGSPLINPIVLNGPMFHLLVHRVRLFECSFDVPLVLLPQYGRPVKMGRPARKAGDIIQPVGHFSGADHARKVMDTPWMTKAEMAQAIPPAYTEWIGKQVLKLVGDDSHKTE